MKDFEHPRKLVCVKIYSLKIRSILLTHAFHSLYFIWLTACKIQVRIIFLCFCYCEVNFETLNKVMLNSPIKVGFPGPPSQKKSKTVQTERL